jgi:hypothetical protein
MGVERQEHAQQQKLAEHERGQRQAGQHAHGRQPVEQAAGPGCGQHADRDPADQPEHHAAGDQGRGAGQVLGQDRGHRLARCVGVAQVAVQQPVQEVPVLAEDRLVKPELPGDLVQLRGGRFLARHGPGHRDRGPGEKQQERAQADCPEHHGTGQRPPDGEGQHGARAAQGPGQAGQPWLRPRPGPRCGR